MEELAIGRANDSLHITEQGNCFRILQAGLTSPERARVAIMKHNYNPESTERK